MNQLYRLADPAPDTSTASPARDLRCSTNPVVSVEYDDGEPATIAVTSSRSEPAPALQCTAADTPSTPLAVEPRVAAMDYDDGDPATIVC